MSKECISLKELDNLLDERNKNRLINYVEEAIRHLESMETGNESLAETIKRGLNIKESKSLIDTDGADYYNVSSTLDEIKLIYFHKVDGWREERRFACNSEDEKELLAKGVILNLLLRACNEVELCDTNLDIKELKMFDALISNYMTDFEKRIEALSTRLLIPQKEFSCGFAKVIQNLYYERNKGKKELLSVELLRSVFIARLQSYGVSKKVAKIRLENAVFDENISYSYVTPDVYASLDDFARGYYDSDDINEPQKKIG